MKPCPQCQTECKDTARFCTHCRYIFDSAPNPTCSNGHPMLPGANVCPICAAEPGGRSATVAESPGGPSPSRGNTFPEVPGAYSGMANRRGNTAVQGPPPLPGAGGTSNMGAPPRGGSQPQGQAGPGRTGTVIVTQPGQSPQANNERRIVAALVTFSAGASGQLFPVRVGRNRIGRDAGNEISVPTDGTMSGTNTFIHYFEGSGSFVVSDNNSQNGTFVNSANLEGQSVKAGNYSTIRAGITEFTLLMVKPPDASAQESQTEKEW